MTASRVPRRVELFVRSLAAGDGQARVGEAIGRLEGLKGRGIVEGYEVYVWGSGVSLDPRIVGTETGTFIQDRVTAFREWAQETGHDLPGFAVRTRSSAMTGRVHRNIEVPAMALCERYEGDIEWIAPCRDEEGSLTTVADRLTALEAVGESSTDSLLPV